MFKSLAQDTRYAVRSLARSPGFTLVATITLALGIGANTAIFSLLNAVLLQPLPYSDADRLVFVWSSSSAFPRAALTPGRLIDFRGGLTSLSGLAGISHLSFNLTDGIQAERVAGASVSSNFFDVLGVRALLGDPFHSGRAADRAVVLSYGFWVRRFGGDRAAIGRSLTLNGRERIVVAVMPAEFEWPSITGSGANNANPPQLWVPAALRDVPRMPQDDPFQDLASNRSTGYLRAVGRLQPHRELADHWGLVQQLDPLDATEPLSRVRGATHQQLAELGKPFLAEPAQVDDPRQGVQRLGGADVVGRLLAADVLLAGLQGEDEAAAPVDVLGLPRDAPRQLADQRLGPAEEAEGRAAVVQPVAQRLPLAERGTPDLVLALALVHHLIITRTIPQRGLIDWLAELGSELVVEFPDREDVMVQRLLARKREGSHPDYTRSAFEESLRARFEIVSSAELPSGTRALYHATPLP